MTYAMLPLTAAIAGVRLTGYVMASNLRLLQECGRATLLLNPVFAPAKADDAARAAVSEPRPARKTPNPEIDAAVTRPPETTVTEPTPPVSKPVSTPASKPASVRKAKTAPRRAAAKTKTKAKPKSPRKPSPPPSMPS